MIDKTKQKELDQLEALRKGVPYKEIRSERRRKEKTSRRDEDDIDVEHAREVKRLRTYSHDDKDDDAPAHRPRTRSIDVQKEQAAQITENTALTVDEWRQQHSITIRSHGSQPQTIPDPFRTFTETPFAPAVLQLFTKAGFVTPTAIEAQAWPLAIQQHDLICIGKTGSGSTSYSCCCGVVALKNLEKGRFISPFPTSLPSLDRNLRIHQPAAAIGRHPHRPQPHACWFWRRRGNCLCKSWKRHRNSVSPSASAPSVVTGVPRNIHKLPPCNGSSMPSLPRRGA
jgi:hypothetical protein